MEVINVKKEPNLLCFDETNIKTEVSEEERLKEEPAFSFDEHVSVKCEPTLDLGIDLINSDDNEIKSETTNDGTVNEVPSISIENCTKSSSTETNLERIFDLSRNQINKQSLPKKIVCLAKKNNIHELLRHYDSYKYVKKVSSENQIIIHCKGTKPFVCSICEYTANSSYYLKRHMLTHTGEKPYACNICDYACTTAYGLKRHMLIHTGVKPYACKLCHYASTNSYSLKLHTLKHTGTKPFSCDVCNYAARTSSRLKIHMLIHTTEEEFIS